MLKDIGSHLNVAIKKCTKSAMVIARGVKSSTMYLIDVPTVAVASNVMDSETWYCCLGYISEKGLQVMKTKGKLLRLASIKLELCENCILASNTHQLRE